MKQFDCLLPKPAVLIPDSGTLRITTGFTLGLASPASRRTVSGASRFLARLAGRTGLFLTEPKPLLHVQPPQTTLFLTCRRPGRLKLNEDESYRLEIGQDHAVLSAETDLGLLRGLETILQLLTADAQGHFLPALRIEDQPRFPWRGLMIDSARHFQPVEVIKRNLEGMAAVKLNVFHWHLTDDQGFRVESKVFPLLHQHGANNEYYTQEQIKEVIAYADALGIRVVPEFDLPGHTTSWLPGYPELASTEGPHTLETGFGIKDAALNPAREGTYTFLATFLQEMAGLFPDEYFHLGGDEVNGKQWSANREIQTFMRTNQLPDHHRLQSYFTQRVQALVSKVNKKMMGWDEILASDLPASVVIQVWRGKEQLITAAKRGLKSILSYGYYIDLMQPAEFHYRNDPLSLETELTREEKNLVLGGEAVMWSEFVSPENIDSRIWPRTAAIAERLWSPPGHCSPEDLYQRLDRISLHLEELGLTHEKNYQMMLRRLAGTARITPLMNLVDLCEPVKLYTRHERRDYTTFSPLTRVVDAARPDAKIPRTFRQLVGTYLQARQKGEKNSKPASELRGWLHLWSVNHDALAPIINSSPLLHEIASLSADLSKIAGFGLQALAVLENEGEKDWPAFSYMQAKESLAAAKKPRGEVELVVVTAIEELVEAAERVKRQSETERHRNPSGAPKGLAAFKTD